jgi:hypothetical protein
VSSFRLADTPTQLAVAAANLIPLFAEEAKKRQIRKPANSVPPSREEQKGESVEHAAKSVGVGATTVHKIARIKRKYPERIKELEDGTKTGFAP